MSNKDSAAAHMAYESDLVPTSVLLMICTRAFGVGVDGMDVRVVVYMSLCASLIQYTQEIGLPGRDGSDADCISLYSLFVARRLYKESKRKVWPAIQLQVSGDFQGGEWSTEDKYEFAFGICSETSEFMSWAKNEKSCRKKGLYSSIDGLECGLCI